MSSNQRFAKEFLIQYGCITDHDAYEHLRVSVEVDKNSPETKGEVFLNGFPVGTVEFISKHKYQAIRYNGSTKIERGVYKKLGRAISSIITDFVSV